MAAPGADMLQPDASPLWGFENNEDNLGDNLNMEDINRKVFGDQQKVFDFDQIIDD